MPINHRGCAPAVAILVAGLQLAPARADRKEPPEGGTTNLPAARRDEIKLLTERTPWRVYLVVAGEMLGTANDCKPRRRRDRSGPSPLPPAGWMRADFDDSAWGRYQDGLGELLGDYGHRQSTEAALLCMRTRFGVSDPAKVDRLQLALTYRGGAVVYVNGREIGRGYMPPGALKPLTLAEDYPIEAYMMPDGKRRLPRSDRPAEHHLDRYEKRIRRLRVRVPAGVLCKGANVLAVELHRTAMRRRDWSTLGFYEAKLTGRGGGLVPYDRAAGKLQVWNAGPLATVATKPEEKIPYRTTWNVGALAVSPKALTRGNPFDPLGPIRTVAPRNGVCSGQVVVSSPRPLKDVSAEMGPLKGPGGAAIPQNCVELRYAVQQEGARYCDALAPRAAAGERVQPVWVLVRIGKDQAPGWYSGTLALRAGGSDFRVPVQVLVAAWTLPDAKQYVSHGSLLHSPDSVAMHYGVEPLSKRHFDLMEKSLELMGQVGNDVAFVPVIHHNHMGYRTGMARWVKRPGGWHVDLSAMETYLDLYAKHCGPPKVLCLVVWKPTFGNQALFRGKKIAKPEPVLVTQLDPKTGRMSELRAPDFGQPGSEAFWRPLLDGVRASVRRRGWDEHCLMLGQAFDRRPLPEVLALFRKIAPAVRWVVFSHWNGDPAPVDGKLVVSGGLEVGYREEVAGGLLPALYPERRELAGRQYLVAGAHRISILSWSSPTAYRNLPNVTGTFCRIALDFWPVVAAGDRRRDLFNTRICGAWVYKSNPVAIVAPGARGAMRTVRFQMLREGVQETEARIALVQALAQASEADRQRYRELLKERIAARRVGKALTQAQISLDWLHLTARMYAAVGRTAGQTSEAKWSAPPREE